MSPRRVINVATPSESSSRSIRRATSSVRSFSNTPPHIAPESWPPWPGSRTTNENGLGVVGDRAVFDSLGRSGVSAWRNCIQAKDPIINNRPANASVFRSARFIRGLGEKFSLHKLIVNQGAQFRIRQRSITNCPAGIALEQSRFDSTVCELFLSIFPNSSGLWQRLCVVCLQSHVSDAPCVEFRVKRRHEVCVRRVLSFEKSFHQFSRLLRPAEHCDILSRLRVGCALACDFPIVVH